MDKIESYLIGIGELLSRSRLVVPDHQRPYAWGVTEVEELFRDFSDAIKRSKSDEYFLGTIVLSRSGGDRKLIVDGQQRIATTTILIGAIRDYFFEKKDTQRAHGILNEYIAKSDIRTLQLTSYIHLAPEDRDFFSDLIVVDPTDEKRARVPSNTAQEKISNAVKAARDFVARIVDTTNDPDSALLDFIEFIKDKARVICVETTSEVNAFIVFEVLNDRGLDLTIADLIKSYLFRVAGDRLEEVSSSWSRMVTSITDSGGEADIRDFIRKAWIAQNGLIREKQLYERIKGEITTKDAAVKYAQKLTEYASVYAAMLNPSHDKWDLYEDTVAESLEIFEMTGVSQIRPLLMAVFDKFDASETNRSIPMLVSWTVRFLICGSGGSGTLETYYSERARDIASGAIKGASPLYEAMKSVLPDDATFERRFAEVSVSKGPIAKWYLRVLEQQATGNSDTIVNPNNDKVNLEHVLPQTFNASNWPGVTEEEHKKLVKRLGNLALVNKRINSRIGNSGFEQKKEALRASKITLTSAIAENTHWTRAEVEKRQNQLAQLAVKAWKNTPAN